MVRTGKGQTRRVKGRKECRSAGAGAGAGAGALELSYKGSGLVGRFGPLAAGQLDGKDRCVGLEIWAR